MYAPSGGSKGAPRGGGKNNHAQIIPTNFVGVVIAYQSCNSFVTKTSHPKIKFKLVPQPDNPGSASTDLSYYILF